MHAREMHRTAMLAALGAERFDVLVVGGGITGAGVARDAAMRGLKVALVERHDFASGTSSRSSRLVHGGVRYLEHGYLHLVFEASRERRILLSTAPHLVHPQAFTWPVYKGARVPRWKLAAGLTLYDALALFRNVGRHQRLSAAAIHEREPALLTSGLRGGAVYYDAATDDARLTLATILSARDESAMVVSHASVTGILRDGNRTTGATVRDELTGRDFTLSARVIVNATGPWSDALRRLEDPAATQVVHGTKGAHIAVERARVGNIGALTLLSPLDGRVMFILEAGDQTIVGTTDTQTNVSPDDVRATEEDVAYLLATANTFFPRAKLERSDVIAAWAGIRPLIASGFGASAASASREHAIARGPAGMLSITGGKLTTYRSMAEEIVDRVEAELGRKPQRAPTDSKPLAGQSRLDDLRALAETEAHLAERIVSERPYLMAEAAYAVTDEMAFTLGDVLIRRIRIAYETRDNGRAAARRIAPLVAPLLGWDSTRVLSEIARYDAEVARQFAVDA